MFKKNKLKSIAANPWVGLVFSMAVAGALAYGIYLALDAREEALIEEARIKHQNLAQRTVSVVVPVADTPKGVRVNAARFATRDIPEDLVYEGVIFASDFVDVKGKPLLRSVKQGRPLRRQDVDASGAKDFSDLLKPGMRALTIRTDDIESTAGMMRPGNRIDLYVVRDKKAAKDKVVKEIRLIYANLTVLATGQSIREARMGDLYAAGLGSSDADSSSYNTVTLEVTAKQAAKIVLAQTSGTLRALLRNAVGAADELEAYRGTQAELNEPEEARKGDEIEFIVGGSGSGSSNAETLRSSGLESTTVLQSEPEQKKQLVEKTPVLTEAQQKRIAKLADALDRRTRADKKESE